MKNKWKHPFAILCGAKAVCHLGYWAQSWDWYKLNIFRIEWTEGGRVWESYLDCQLRAGAESLVHYFSLFPGILSTVSYIWQWIYWITSVIVSVHKKISAVVASDVGVTPKLGLCSAIKRSFLLVLPFSYPYTHPTDLKSDFPKCGLCTPHWARRF